MPKFTLQGTTAPGFAPSYLGQQYINTSGGGTVYFAVGTASSADWKSAGGGVGDALTSGNLSQFAATTSAQLAGVLSDKTGWNTGALAVFSDNPTLTRAQIATGAITSDTPALNITQVWNNASVAFNAINLEITNTASAAASNFIKCHLPSGTTLFKVDKSGFIYGPGAGYVKMTGNSFSIAPAGVVRGGMDSAGGFGVSSGGWIGFSSLSSADPSSGLSADVVLVRDAANTLALRNSTNAQTLNIYGTSATSNADYVRGSLKGTSGSFIIAAESGGNGSANLDIVLTPKGTGVVSCGTEVQSGGNVRVVGAGKFYFSSRSEIYSPSDGVLRMQNSGGSSFDRLQFGGTTSAFPAIKRISAGLGIKLADDSAFADLESLTIKTGAPSGGTAQKWKLGSKTAGAVTLDSANYVEAEINGVAVKLLIAT